MNFIACVEIIIVSLSKHNHEANIRYILNDTVF